MAILPARALLQTVLPDSGWLVGLAFGPGGQKRQQAFDNIDKLLAWGVRLSSQGFDIYHACASFAQNKGPKGEFKLRGYANVHRIGCLWLDIDTRESHASAKYATRVEAAAALAAFCAAAGFPLPSTVSSGAGLHCYWTLWNELPLEQWKILAGALKATCHRFHLDADPARTSDASSVLRTPGTIHQKSGQPVELIHLADAVDHTLFARLNHGQGSTGTTPAPSTVSVGRDGGLIGSLHGIDFIDPGAIGAACRQIAALELDPSGIPEPVHYLACGLFGHVGIHGIEHFKHVSHGYREQANADSDAWIDAKWAQWQAQVGGPPTCQAFEARNPGGCEGCPHRGKISSPLHLGRGKQFPEKARAPEEDRDALSEMPPLPQPWAMDGLRLVLPSENKDGSYAPLVVSDFPIYLAGLYDSEIVDGNGAYLFRQYFPGHGWRSITIPSSDMDNGRGLPAIRGYFGNIRNPDQFRRFVQDSHSAWIHRGNKMSMRFEQCGWKQSGRSFVLGNHHYVCHAGGQVVPELTTCSPELTTRGKWLGPRPGADARQWISTWNRLYGDVSHDMRMAAHLALYASFGSIFMKRLAPNEGGCILHFVDPRTGVGKTDCLQAVSSVWGAWKGVSVNYMDTAVARGLTLAALSNVPLAIDELSLIFKKDSPEVLRDFVMMVSLGHDRKRGEQSGQGIRHAMGQWSMVPIAFSNHSVVDQLLTFSFGTDAPAQRLLELMWPGIKFGDFSIGKALVAELQDHAGAPGHEFLKHVLRPEILAHSDKLLKESYKAMAKHLRQEDRLRALTLACMLVGGLTAQDIGLAPENPYAVLDWALEQLRAQRTQEASIAASPFHTAIELVADYLIENTNNCLKIAHGFVPGINQVHVAHPPQKLMMRWETETGRLYLAQRPFKQWLVARGLSWTLVMSQLEEARITLPGRRIMTLGAGTTVPSAPQPVVFIDLNNRLMGGLAPELEKAPLTVNDT